MQETPAAFRESLSAGSTGYPADYLDAFRYHTGARLRPLDEDEYCPILFRDIGPLAMVHFLEGTLRRLAGPYSPITYMRTAAYQEPYVDYEQIGRLIFLRPLELQVWHSGMPHVFVATASRWVTSDSMVFLPGHVGFEKAEKLLGDATNADELKEALGASEYADSLEDTHTRLVRLNDECCKMDELLRPLRLSLQSHDSACSERAREAMWNNGISEADLCKAWHHLPRERREFLLEITQDWSEGHE